MFCKSHSKLFIIFIASQILPRPASDDLVRKPFWLWQFCSSGAGCSDASGGWQGHCTVGIGHCGMLYWLQVLISLLTWMKKWENSMALWSFYCKVSGLFLAITGPLRTAALSRLSWRETGIEWSCGIWWPCMKLGSVAAERCEIQCIIPSCQALPLGGRLAASRLLGLGLRQLWCHGWNTAMKCRNPVEAYMDIIAAAIPYADKQGFLGWVSLRL